MFAACRVLYKLSDSSRPNSVGCLDRPRLCPVVFASPLTLPVWAAALLSSPEATCVSQLIFPTSQLLFHVDNGDGRITAVYYAGIPGHMCNGRWHKVTAKKIKNHLQLVVDGVQVDAQGLNSASTSADTNDPVFVGGFPGERWLFQ